MQPPTAAPSALLLGAGSDAVALFEAQQARLHAMLQGTARSYQMKEHTLSHHGKDASFAFFQGKQGQLKGHDFPFFLCKNNGFEGSVTDLAGEVLTASNAHPSDELVLDIGSNSGFYGTMAAAHGYSVIAFDLQEDCLHMAHAALKRFAERAEVLQLGLSSTTATVSLSSGKCDGSNFFKEGGSAALGEGSTVLAMPLDVVASLPSMTTRSLS